MKAKPDFRHEDAFLKATGNERDISGDGKRLSQSGEQLSSIGVSSKRRRLQDQSTHAGIGSGSNIAQPPRFGTSIQYHEIIEQVNSNGNTIQASADIQGDSSSPYMCEYLFDDTTYYLISLGRQHCSCYQCFTESASRYLFNRANP